MSVIRTIRLQLCLNVRVLNFCRWFQLCKNCKNLPSNNLRSIQYTWRIWLKGTNPPTWTTPTGTPPFWCPTHWRSTLPLTSTFCAVIRGENVDLTTTFTSMWVRDVSRTRGITRKGSTTSLVLRYLWQQAGMRRDTRGRTERFRWRRHSTSSSHKYEKEVMQFVQVLAANNLVPETLQADSVDWDTC